MENKTVAELLFIRSDLTQVIAAQESIGRAHGYHMVPKLGQYNDELFQVAAELRARGIR